MRQHLLGRGYCHSYQGHQGHHPLVSRERVLNSVLSGSAYFPNLVSYFWVAPRSDQSEIVGKRRKCGPRGALFRRPMT